MAKGRGPWQEGRRAWERLAGWYQDTPSAAPGHPDDGDSALTALSSIGLVRRLLDQAELEAVRTGRRHGKSWSEIATKLGVTRQSAWEKWRDLDDADASRAVARGAEHDIASETASRAAAELVGNVPGSAAESADVDPRAARQLRRRSSVRVPNVVGMTWDDARHALQRVQLVAAGSDPDGPPLAATGWPQGVVTDQSPESGAKVPPGSSVRLWVDPGGGSGVREPRRPRPNPKSGPKMLDEPTEEAAGW